MTEALLRVDGVSLAFGGLRALQDVSVAVPAGSIVGLIGPNGAGKTTLFNVISGLQPPDAGTVSFGEHDISRLRPDQRHRLGMARSFQHLGLIQDETVGVNLCAANNLATSYSGLDLLVRPWRWWRSEQEISAAAFARATDLALDDLWEARVEDLSFGRARFVEIACVLMGEPKLLLLDEPTTGLDINEVSELARVLKAQRDQGVSVLVVAHDVHFVMTVCDYVYVLAQGQLLSQGSPAEVQSDPAVVEAYLGRSA